jgi:hypothetical protein
MANAYDMAKSLVTALRADTTFTNYCTSALTTVPKFFVGMDGNTPPDAGDIPFIAIVPASENLVDNQYIEHVLNIGAVITNDTVTETTATKTVDFAGYDKILDFSTKLLDGIQRAIATSEKSTASTTMSLKDWTPARIAFYRPQYHSTREITLTTSYTLPS